MTDTHEERPTLQAADPGSDEPSGAKATTSHDENDQHKKDRDKKKKGGNFLALLAILLGLGAIVGTGYNFVQMGNLKTSLEETAAPVQDTSEIDNQLDQLSTNLNANENEIKALKRSQSGLDQRLGGLDALKSRVQGTEKSLENLQGVSESARQTWVLSEAQYYLQSANTRLQLAGDINTAIAALKAADDRLSALGDPSLFRVRELLADEVLALEAMPQPDVAGMALQLASLGEQVPRLPLKTPLPEIAATQTPVDDDKTGVDRAMAVAWSSVKGLVTIRKTGESVTPLMTQEEELLLIRNLQLQLQTARLALLQKKQSEFQNSLRAARQWINEHFDTDQQAVTNTLTKLSELETVEIQPNLPDISGSLNALRSTTGSTQ